MKRVAGSRTSQQLVVREPRETTARSLWFGLMLFSCLAAPRRLVGHIEGFDVRRSRTGARLRPGVSALNPDTMRSSEAGKASCSGLCLWTQIEIHQLICCIDKREFPFQRLTIHKDQRDPSSFLPFWVNILLLIGMDLITTHTSTSMYGSDCKFFCM